jgi:hypothetical protein
MNTIPLLYCSFGFRASGFECYLPRQTGLVLVFVSCCFAFTVSRRERRGATIAKKNALRRYFTFHSDLALQALDLVFNLYLFFVIWLLVLPFRISGFQLRI